MKILHLRYRLLTRLLASHILLASIPIIITGLVLIHTARQSIERLVVNRNLEFAKQQTNEKVIQKEIDHLITQTNEMNQETKNQTENMQLAVITSEYQSTHDLLDTLTLEIDTLHKQIHERG